MVVSIIILTCAIILIIVNIPNYNVPEDAMVFTSAFTRGGHPTAPEKLIFTKDGMVIWSKNRGLNYLYLYRDKVSIPFHQITSMHIHVKPVGVDIQIIGNGVQQINASRFTGEDATKIEAMLKSIMTSIYNYGAN